MKFDEKLILMGHVFAWESHYKHIKRILRGCWQNEGDVDVKRKYYITDYKMAECLKLCKIWNNCHAEFADLVFKEYEALKQYMQLKINLYTIIAKGYVDACYNNNKN